MAGRYDIQIEQGATFTLPITIKNGDGTAFDLTNYTAWGNIRKTHKSTVIVAQFSFNYTDRIAGQMEVVLSDEVTGSITAGETSTVSTSKYVYDIELHHSSGTVKRILEGFCYVNPEVTRS